MNDSTDRQKDDDDELFRDVEDLEIYKVDKEVAPARKAEKSSL